jgi:hypothetical protein
MEKEWRRNRERIEVEYIPEVLIVGRGSNASPLQFVEVLRRREAGCARDRHVTAPFVDLVRVCAATLLLSISDRIAPE